MAEEKIRRLEITEVIAMEVPEVEPVQRSGLGGEGMWVRVFWQ